MAFQFKTQYGWDEQPKEPSQSTPPGYYPAKIVAAEEKYSKSGKPMLQLKLEVDAGGARTVDVNEYLLLDTTAPWKVEQYLAAIGYQFSAGQDVSISANTFLGGRLYILTYNEPGQKNPERLYIKPLKAFRVQDVKAPGPLPADQLEMWGLNPDGTRKGTRDEVRANAQPWQQQPQQQSAWGAPAQAPQQGGWGQPTPHQQAKANGYMPQPAYQQQPAGYQQGQGAPAPMPNEEDDDIPF